MEDAYGLRPGCNTADAVRSVRQIQDYLESSGKAGFLCRLEWETALDKMKLEALIDSTVEEVWHAPDVNIASIHVG